MPYSEYKNWKRFYQLEPWGWHDQEYRTASLLAMLVNVNAGKRKHQKKVSDFERDMLKGIKRAYYEYGRQAMMREKYEQASPEERKRMIAQAFGA